MPMQAPQKRKKGKAGNGDGALMNFVGMKGPGKAGMLDNDDYDDGDIEEGRPKQSKIRGNQDLWLLYLLFKAISLLW